MATATTESFLRQMMQNNDNVNYDPFLSSPPKLERMDEADLCPKDDGFVLKCHQCGRNYSTAYVLRRHIEMVHKGHKQLTGSRKKKASIPKKLRLKSPSPMKIGSMTSSVVSDVTKNRAGLRSCPSCGCQISKSTNITRHKRSEICRMRTAQRNQFGKAATSTAGLSVRNQVSPVRSPLLPPERVPFRYAVKHIGSSMGSKDVGKKHRSLVATESKTASLQSSTYDFKPKLGCISPDALEPQTSGNSAFESIREFLNNVRDKQLTEIMHEKDEKQKAADAVLSGKAKGPQSRPPPEQLHLCMFCPFETNSLQAATKHRTHHTEVFALRCPYCSYTTDKDTELAIHMSSHFRPNFYQRANAAPHKLPNVCLPEPALSRDVNHRCVCTFCTRLFDTVEQCTEHSLRHQAVTQTVFAERLWQVHTGTRPPVLAESESQTTEMEETFVVEQREIFVDDVIGEGLPSAGASIITGTSTEETSGENSVDVDAGEKEAGSESNSLEENDNISTEGDDNIDQNLRELLKFGM